MYLSRIQIENFRGIKSLNVDFNSEINIIIGENGSNKTALIDAVRLLYNIGQQQKDLYVKEEDFHIGSENISFTYFFKDLNDLQKGAFHECLVLGSDEKDDLIKVKLYYRKQGTKILSSFFVGETDEFRPSLETFAFFKHCYLGALRDSTRALLNNRDNILGNLINKQIERNKSESEYETLIEETNNRLLEFKEVLGSRTAINKNLEKIYKTSIENQVGLLIESSKVENILNIIKPYLPHDKDLLKGDGLSLKQNSLGYNNLIYIATILGDIHEGIKDDNISHYCLLIEEPEAHLHPQLQLNLFEFLKESKKDSSSQLFITTHSPTLTSRVPLDNLIVLNKQKALIVGDIFNEPSCELESEDRSDEDDERLDLEFETGSKQRKRQLERYIDVTKSQLFFAKGIVFVEGISEELLLPVFSTIFNRSLLDYRIEVVNVDGTSFYPFLSLFSGDPKKTLDIPAAILTDDDRFTASKDSTYSFKKVCTNTAVLSELKDKIENAKVNKRISNLINLASLSKGKILISSSFKTFEFELIKTNVSCSKKDVEDNLLIEFILKYINEKKRDMIISYLNKLPDKLSLNDQFLISLLIWKALPSKAQFAQDLSIYLIDNMSKAKTHFILPAYIKKALDHLIPNLD